MPRKIPRARNTRKPFSEHLKDLLSLHTGERRAFLFLTFLLLIAIGWAVYQQWFHRQQLPDLAEVEQEMMEWLQRPERRPDADTLIVQAELVPFDPNDLDRQGWIDLGLTGRQAESILRYVEKGGKFRTKPDVRKMYTISPETYSRLEPFILLPDSFVAREVERRPFDRRSERREFDQPRTEARPPATLRTITPIEVNSADSTELVTLPGVGPAFARGIVKYRNSLGGFVSLDQLNEVFVLRDKPDVVERLKQMLWIDPSRVERIDINSITAEELKAHPYLTWKIANGLINYRRHHGPFRSVEDVKKSVLVNDSLYQKIAPYLKVE